MRGGACVVGETTEEDGRELSSLSLSLESESSNVPSPMWRKLGEVGLSPGAREGVDTEVRRMDVIARGRLARNAALEGCREKINGERVELVDGVLTADWGLEITCPVLETHLGDDEFEGETDEAACGESPEVGYCVWELNMGSDDKPLGVSGGRWEAVGDSALEEVVMAAGAERD